MGYYFHDIQYIRKVDNELRFLVAKVLVFEGATWLILILDLHMSRSRGGNV